MDKFNFDNINLKSINLNPTSHMTQFSKEHLTQIEKAGEQIWQQKQEAVEREKRNLELQETMVEQNSQILKLQQIEVDFLKSISEDAAQLVSLLNSLEALNKINGTITESNMLLIQQRLDEVIANSTPQTINQMFLEEIKKQIAEKGAGHGIQFLIMGLKMLVSGGSPE